MDIEQAYRNMVSAWGAARGAATPEDAMRALDELVDAVEAVDGWLRGGGFLPAAWDHDRVASQ